MWIAHIRKQTPDYVKIGASSSLMGEDEGMHPIPRSLTHSPSPSVIVIARHKQQRSRHQCRVAGGGKETNVFLLPSFMLFFCFLFPLPLANILPPPHLPPLASTDLHFGSIYSSPSRCFLLIFVSTGEGHPLNLPSTTYIYIPITSNNKTTYLNGRSKPIHPCIL